MAQNIGPRLDLRQSQQLVMTPQLQQAIKLLQMNNVELATFIEEELEKNPLLERAEQAEQRAEENDAPDPTQDAPDRAPDEPLQKEDFDTDVDNVFTNTSDAEKKETNTDFDAGSNMADIGKGGDIKFDSPDYNIENTLTREQSLRDYLMEQLYIEIENPQDRMIGAALIDQLDEAGYLRHNLSDLAEQLGCGEDRLRRVLTLLYRFDPAGLFAQNLEECLALQLKDKNRYDPAMEKLLQHLDLLAEHDTTKLKQICGVDDDDLNEMIEEIRNLDPKPATKFDNFIVQTILPDVLMRRLPKDKGGGWAVELNNDTLPRVLVNQQYYAEINADTADKDSKTYLAERLQSANWLVKAMDQRAQTILKVSTEIIKHQDAFFNYGIEYLKPLTLKEIAKNVDVHESTVSRVTTNKYIGTPRGLFELKFFFSTAISSTDGGADIAADAVKARLKTLIDSEDPKKILSDDALVKQLKNEGIDIARRTVAKYREAMHIPSSVQRRKQKKNKQK